MKLRALILCCLGVPAIAGDLPAPVTDVDFMPTTIEAVELGRLLFYDPVLSGSNSVSCATCHHPRLGTSDGLSLGLGDGGSGLGTDRIVVFDNLPEKRIPRNAPALFNLGALEFTSLFHDGRLEADDSKPGGIRTPLGQDMVAGFSGVLSAQTMFPVLSADEMAGHYSENEISRAVRLGMLAHEGGAWDLIAKKVAAIPEYRARFDAVIDDSPIQFTDIANAMADFIAVEWRATDSPFDQVLAGTGSISPQAQAGMQLFYGKAGCSACHSGPFQTDHGFHAIAMPQIGPGKAERFETHNRDTGRMRVTGQAEDAYRFRTPSLRNVALTGPYGHTGAFATLQAVVRHHLDPVASLMSYDPTQAVLPAFTEATEWDMAVMASAADLMAIAGANELSPVTLSDADIIALVAFLHALTDPISQQGRMGAPQTVPSGFAVDQ